MAVSIAHIFPWQDPLELFEALAHRPFTVFLDSSLAGSSAGQYSYIAWDPYAILAAAEGGAFYYRAGGSSKFISDPFSFLKTSLQTESYSFDPALPPFQGGAIGYMTYECGRYFDCMAVAGDTPQPIPEFIFAFYRSLLAFDHHHQHCVLFLPHDSPPESLAVLSSQILASPPPITAGVISTTPAGGATPVNATLNRHSYEAAVGQVLDYIYAGDIYQANLALRFFQKIPPGFDAVKLYKILRARSPAPFTAYGNFGDLKFLSSSPERFLKIDKERGIETRPIKGTRPRGKSSEQDRALALDLLESEKDRAENLMIVDLLRNDLSKIAVLGSVTVPELFTLESYANVHHLVSCIRAKLDEGKDSIDLIAASFPGGSITGAPKIRAMDIIAELEPIRRGLYCGSILWLGFDGQMDSNIAIRTITLTPGLAGWAAGAGIVADSDPAAEYAECLAKASAMRQAILESLSEDISAPSQSAQAGLA